MWKKARLSVLDLVILIAATAPGLLLARALPDYVAVTDQVMVCNELAGAGISLSTSGMGWNTMTGRWFTTAGVPLRSRPSYWLGHIPCWSAPCLLCWTLAALALGLRMPRPKLRRMARRPGVAAGLAVVSALVVEAAESLRFQATRGWWFGQTREHWSMYEAYALTCFVPLAGFSVAAWWMCLAASGRWSAEVNAGGALGRGLGWCWIVMAVSSQLGAWCFPLNY